MKKTMDKSQKTNIIIVCVFAVITGVELFFVRNGIPQWLFACISSLFACLTVAVLLGAIKKQDSLFRLGLTLFFVAVFCLTIYTLLYVTGAIDKIMEVENLRGFIRDEPLGALIFILISFAQVTFIPLPSTVVSMAGTVIFGFWKGMLLSFIGQVAGSMFAFWLGKKFGKKLVVWMIGQPVYDKYKKLGAGRDKVILTFMIIFPYFPDDIICMLLGLTSMRYSSFLVLMILTRPLSIGTTGIATSLGKNILSYGFAGLFVVALFVLLIMVLLVYCWKYGDKIDKMFVGIIEKILKRCPKKHSKFIEKEETVSKSEKLGEQEANLTDLTVPPDNLTDPPNEIIE
jgi:uncharacterized membrane protein YdjX (TVP38/TMEM64 family)